MRNQEAVKHFLPIIYVLFIEFLHTPLFYLFTYTSAKNLPESAKYFIESSLRFFVRSKFAGLERRTASVSAIKGAETPAFERWPSFRRLARNNPVRFSFLRKPEARYILSFTRSPGVY